MLEMKASDVQGREAISGVVENDLPVFFPQTICLHWLYRLQPVGSKDPLDLEQPQGRGAEAPSPDASEPRMFVHPLTTTPRRDMSPIRISIRNAVEDSHDPSQGITDLEGCSLAGLGSALPRQRLTVTP